MLSQAEIDCEPRLYQHRVDEEISLLDILILIVRRRWLILKLTLAFAFASSLVSMLIPSRYTATTVILPPQQNGSNSAALMAQAGSLGSFASMAGGGLSLKNPNDLQLALLKSETVEDAVLKRFDLQSLYRLSVLSAARRRLEQSIQISDEAKDALIRISVTDRNPEQAANIANGYVEEFRKSTSTLAVTEASQRRMFFDQQLRQSKDGLAAAEEDLKKTEQETGLIQLDSQARAVIESAAQLSAQIANKEVQIRVMQSYSTNRNPDVEIAQQELGGLRAQEAQMNVAGNGNGGVLVHKGSIEQSSLAYVRKLREVKYQETIFDLLARQLEAAKMDEARQGSVLQVIDRALIPDERASPRRTLIIAGSAAGGFLLAICWILIEEGFSRFSRNPREKERLQTLQRMVSFRRTTR